MDLIYPFTGSPIFLWQDRTQLQAKAQAPLCRQSNVRKVSSQRLSSDIACGSSKPSYVATARNIPSIDKGQVDEMA